MAHLKKKKSLIIFNWPSKASLPFIFVLFQATILPQINVKFVHLVSGDGIWTHDLLDMNLFPQQLDHRAPAHRVL